MSVRASLVLAVAAIAALVGAPPALAQPAGRVEEPVVVVRGEGLVKAYPDQAWVTLAVESRSRNPKEAQGQNAKTMTAVQERLLAAGLAKDAVRTLSYDLQLESDFVNGRQVPRGYVARNSIEVRLDDIARVGEVIDLATAAGVTAVHGVRFDVKAREAMERQALERAAADARARAAAAAAGVGAAIGRILRVEEIGRGYPVPGPVPMMREVAMADARGPTTPVAPGEIEIRAAVTLTAALK